MGKKAKKQEKTDPVEQKHVKTTSQLSANTAPWIEPAKWWGTYFLVTLICLTGRYDWTQEIRQYAWRGYLSSAYMFILLTVVLYYFIKPLKGQKFAKYVAIGTGLLFALPYRWFSLDSLYYHADRPAFWNNKNPALPSNKLNWLPDFTLDSMPYEITFFLILAGAATALTFLYIKGRAKTQNTDRDELKNKILPWLFLFLLLLAQSWLHLSMRSPYSYVPHFERPLYTNYYYTVSLFEGGQGNVNEDYYVFRDLEEYFMGTPKNVNTLMVRRPFVFYLSSQLSYFINPFYVFLVLNPLIWLLACYSCYKYCALKFENGKEIGKYATFLLATGSGFIMFATQPMNYMAGYAVIMIALYLYEIMILQKDGPLTNDYILFGFILGLLSLVYDIYTVYLYFILYPLVMQKRSPHNEIISIIISFMVVFGFLAIGKHILGLTFNNQNSVFISIAIKNIKHLIANPSFGEVYQLSANTISIFFNSMARAFLILPFVLSAIGAFFIRKKETAFLLLLILLPSYLNIAFLSYGQVKWGNSYLSSLPRFVYTAYPAVYILVALLIFEIRQYFISKQMSQKANAFVWVTLGILFLLSNIDVFGYPELYYYFYWPHGGFFN